MTSDRYNCLRFDYPLSINNLVVGRSEVMHECKMGPFQLCGSTPNIDQLTPENSIYAVPIYEVVVDVNLELSDI